LKSNNIFTIQFYRAMYDGTVENWDNIMPEIYVQNQRPISMGETVKSKIVLAIILQTIYHVRSAASHF
jgi:hypothetical protein